MTWDWMGSAEQLLRAALLPAWVLLAVAGLLGLVLLVALLRTERTFANGILAALTFAALAVAVASQVKTGSPERAAHEPVAGLAFSSAVPALACIDDMAGETALTACEKALFGSPETVAAAVVYASAQLNRLTASGDAAAANRDMTPQFAVMRRAIERDRYGIFAYVLATRDNCQPEQCAAFAAMSDHNQVAANMNDLIYEGLVSRYAPSWNAAAPPLAPSAQASVSVGRPTSMDFPTAASIPPVNIMSAEPPVRASEPPAPPPVAPPLANNAPAGEPAAKEPEAARKSAAASRNGNAASSAAKQKRPAPQKNREAEGPVQLTPGDR